MSRRQILIRSSLPSPSSANKHRPLLDHSLSTCSGRLAEFAGGTTAECAAICCCCPCGLVNFLFLTVYKVPAGLCRRAWRRKKRLNKGLLPSGTKRCKCGCDDVELQIHPVSGGVISGVCNNNNNNNVKLEGFEDDVDVEKMVKFENEMWESFYSAGFWRSPSQRETPSSSSASFG